MVGEVGCRGRGGVQPDPEEGPGAPRDAAARAEAAGPSPGAGARPRWLRARRRRHPRCAPLCARRSRRAPGVSKGGQLTGARRLAAPPPPPTASPRGPRPAGLRRVLGPIWGRPNKGAARGSVARAPPPRGAAGRRFLSGGRRAAAGPGGEAPAVSRQRASRRRRARARGPARHNGAGPPRNVPSPPCFNRHGDSLGCVYTPGRDTRGRGTGPRPCRRKEYSMDGEALRYVF